MKGQSGWVPARGMGARTAPIIVIGARCGETRTPCKRRIPFARESAGFGRRRGARYNGRMESTMSQSDPPPRTPLTGAYRYCPWCGTQLVISERQGEELTFCPTCEQFIFREPKVSAVALVTATVGLETRALLVRRAVRPEKGNWALPGGYVRADELPRDAVRREVLEETGLHVTIGALLDQFPLISPTRAPGFVLAFAAQPAKIDPQVFPGLVAADDAADARWFTAETLPDAIAFASTRLLLAHWRARQQAQNPPSPGDTP